MVISHLKVIGERKLYNGKYPVDIPLYLKIFILAEDNFERGYIRGNQEYFTLTNNIP